MPILLLFTLVMCLSPFNLIRAGSAPQCTSSALQASFKGYRDTRGGWKSEMRLEHRGKKLEIRDNVPWTVDLQQNSTTCDGEETVIIVATVTVPPSVKIPEGYELFEGEGYYKFHPNGTSWTDARKICAQEGAHLVIINSENEANIMRELFTRFPRDKVFNASAYNSIWVGIYEQGSNGKYYTIFGNPLSSTGFTRWVAGQPDDTGINDCITLERTTVGLYDLLCQQTAMFVCEIETN